MRGKWPTPPGYRAQGGMHEQTLYCDTGKVRHPSRALARRHAKTLRGRVGRRGEESLGEYRCRRCGGWHVGNRFAKGPEDQT